MAILPTCTRHASWPGHILPLLLVQPIEVEISKEEIRTVLKQAQEDKLITKQEFEAMDPTCKDVAKFYLNFKVHKEHKHGEAPPPRPIVSGSNSMTEGIGQYVAYHINRIAKLHETYIEDTPDFLRCIDNILSLIHISEPTRPY